MENVIQRTNLQQVESDDETQTLSWLFTQGLDPRCSDPCTANNCCGVHIHEGTSCASADAVGGHFWDMDQYPADPWQDVRYVIEGSLPSKVNDLKVTTGLSAAQVNGRTVIVHDYDGVRIGCATIKICIDTGSTVKGAIDKLEEAVDQIKDALTDLEGVVAAKSSNHSGKGYSHSGSGYHSYHSSSHPKEQQPYKCNNICGDICSTQHPQPASCQHMCKTRQNAIIPIAQVFCSKGLCPFSPMPMLTETNEEVGLLQRKSHQDEEVGACRPVSKYCTLFCNLAVERLFYVVGWIHSIVGPQNLLPLRRMLKNDPVQKPPVPHISPCPY